MSYLVLIVVVAFPNHYQASFLTWVALGNQAFVGLKVIQLQKENSLMGRVNNKHHTPNRTYGNTLQAHNVLTDTHTQRNKNPPSLLKIPFCFSDNLNKKPALNSSILLSNYVQVFPLCYKCNTHSTAQHIQAILCQVSFPSSPSTKERSQVMTDQGRSEEFKDLPDTHSGSSVGEHV